MSDVEISITQQATIEALQQGGDAIPMRGWLAQEAAINYEVECTLAADDPAAFWADKAKNLDWSEPWTKVFDFKPPNHPWFLGGKLNATVNCIDRHVHSDRRNKAALLWVGEDGDERSYTYNRLYREMNRFANTLKRLGVQCGDRVIIYMPLTPEGIITMLACARIGAIHSRGVRRAWAPSP